MAKERFKHIPTSGGGKQDCPRKATKESIQNYKGNSFWDSCLFEKKRKQKLNESQ